MHTLCQCRSDLAFQPGKQIGRRGPQDTVPALLIQRQSTDASQALLSPTPTVFSLMCAARWRPPITAAPVQMAWPKMPPMVTPKGSSLAASLQVQWNQRVFVEIADSDLGARHLLERAANLGPQAKWRCANVQYSTSPRFTANDYISGAPHYL